jgi:hypothetical protein
MELMRGSAWCRLDGRILEASADMHMHLRFAFPLVLALALASPAAAQQEPAQPQPLRIVISKVDCSRLIRHAASADVAYRPGEGAGGRKVVPADLDDTGGSINFLPDVLEFDVAINPVTYGRQVQGVPQVGAASGVQFSNTRMNVAAVRYDVARGDLTINGQPVGPRDQGALAEACRRQGVR